MQTAADVTLAVGLAGLSAYTTLTATTPIVVAGGPTSIAGPRWIVAAAQVVAALALIWRRRAPLATLVTVVVVLAVPTLAFGGSEGLGSFMALGVALYSAGAHCERRQAVIALAVVSAFWVLLVVRDPLNEDVRDMLGSWPVYLVYVVVWLFGVYLRTRRLYVAQLRERAERAEQDREERVRAATADERARIARELHDAVAHAMSVIVVQAEAADEMLTLGAPERARVPIERIQRIGREGLVEMRRLLGVLRHDTSPAFAPLPGIPALQPLVDDVSATGLPVALTIEGEPRALADRRRHLGLPHRAGGAHERDQACVGLEGRRTPALRRPVGARGRGRRCRPSAARRRRPRARRDARAGRALRRHAERRCGRGRRLSDLRDSAVGGTGMIRILLVDDQELVRDGFSMILDAQPDMEVVGYAEDGAGALAQAQSHMPDVVVMDVRMPRVDGIEATRQLRAAGFEQLAILMLTTFDLDEYVYEALRAGANGFMLKDVPRAVLIEGVRTVAAGDSLLAPAITQRLIERYVASPPPSGGAAT